MKNAWQKRVTIICMLIAMGSYLVAVVPSTHAYSETDEKEVVSGHYPSSEDAYKSSSPAPVYTAEETTGNPLETPTMSVASPTSAATEPEPSQPPAPSDTASPELISPADVPTDHITPEPTETPVPSADASAGADTLATPEALSVRSLYIKSNHFAAIGQTVTLELMLVADNATGQSLSRFGVHFQTSSDAVFKVKAINQADTVRFVNQTLLVDGASVRAGHVTVEGEVLKLTLSLQPFPEGGEATSTKVSIALLDGSGNEVGLQESDQDNARIDLSVSYHLREQTASPAEPEETAEPGVTGIEADTPAPPANQGSPTPAPTEASPLDLTVEPDAGTNQEPENTDVSQFTSEEPPVSEEPTDTPVTEAPAENRQLALLASIPYDQLKVGDTLTLQAQMIGYEGMNLPIRIQWQQHTHGEWVNVEGANGDTLTVAITPENLHSAWRYSITIEQ